MTQPDLSWQDLGPCLKTGGCCSQFFPTALQQDGSATIATGFVLFGMLCTCGCPGNQHKRHHIPPYDNSSGSTVDPPPSDPPSMDNSSSASAPGSTFSGAKAQPGGFSSAPGAFSSFLNGAKARKARQQENLHSSIPQFDPANPVSLRFYVGFEDLIQHILLQIFKDSWTHAAGGAPDRRRKKKVEDDDISGPPTKKGKTTATTRVPPRSVPTKPIKEKKEKILNFTVILLGNTASVDSRQGHISPNGAE